MSPAGADAFMVQVRAGLLDALEALQVHRDAVVVIGAQAVYLHTGSAPVAVAEYTKDSDLALDPRALQDDPRVEAAMEQAHFTRAPNRQPGAWVSPRGIPVDLMVPEALAGPGSASARGARIPPHDRRTTRRARGLEGCVIDAEPTTITALDPADSRTFVVRVAGPAALLVAKLHKIAERVATPGRLVDKDAHDVYRVLQAVPTENLASRMATLLDEPLSGDAAAAALAHLDTLFAAGPQSIGCVMAGRTEEGVGDPEQVAVSVAFLAADVVTATDAMMKRASDATSPAPRSSPGTPATNEVTPGAGRTG